MKETKDKEFSYFSSNTMKSTPLSLPVRFPTHMNIVLTRSGERQKSRRNGTVGRQRYNVEVFDLRAPAAYNTAAIAHAEIGEELGIWTVAFCGLQTNHCHLLTTITS